MKIVNTIYKKGRISRIILEDGTCWVYKYEDGLIVRTHSEGKRMIWADTPPYHFIGSAFIRDDED
jgi:hypothetical protein